MPNRLVLALIIHTHIGIAFGIKLPGNRPHLGLATIPLNSIVNKWLFVNEIDPSVEKIIKDELIWQIKGFNPDKATLASASGKLDKIARDISGRILKRKNKFKLNPLFLLEDVKESSDFTRLFSFLREDPVVYSIWNINPRLFLRGHKVELEIQYRFSIKVRGVPKFYFSPVVSYQFNFQTGSLTRPRFSNEVITLHTHPFIPWKRHTVGTFKLYPPLITFKYNV